MFQAGDVLAVEPVDGWRGAGLYVLDLHGNAEVLRCVEDMRGSIIVSRDDGTVREALSLERFREFVSGYVRGGFQGIDGAQQTPAQSMGLCAR